MVSRSRQLLSELARELDVLEQLSGTSRLTPPHTETLALTPTRWDDLGQLQHFELRPHRVCRPFRLVVMTEDPTWLVCNVSSGGRPVLTSTAPAPAPIFTPLPSWMIDPPLEFAEVRAEFPLRNIEPITLQPGMVFSLQLEWNEATFSPGTESPMRKLPVVYVLADVLV
jgi:hypothetical protein